MKRIIIFSDGTWNSPVIEGVTNVLRMARGVCPESSKGISQLIFYDWGVGSSVNKYTGGLVGVGINKNIQDCYRFIIHNFNIGDQLFFFGFSRGAYTVRSLVGLIRNCGILKREYADKITLAYSLYRLRDESSHPDETSAVSFRYKYSVENITPVEFIGVWDTVGHLGIPHFHLFGREEYEFHDTDPSKIINHARHALSIDENRKDFKPTLWEKKKGVDLLQLWFSGAHSDIGGGYKESGLSDCSCKWMYEEATKYDLEFEPHFINSLEPDALSKIHNEYKYLYYLRGPEFTRIISDAENVHKSAKIRWDSNHNDYQEHCKALKCMS